MVAGRARQGGVPGTVTWGLLAVFVVHDLEELVTMPAWVAERVGRLRRRYPDAPVLLWKVLDAGPAHTAAAIGMMGVLVGSAAAAGFRTGGRSDFFQATLTGFGLHALMHVGQSAAVGGYTPGVVTAPTLVAPYTLWAWRELGRAGVRNDEFTVRDAATAAAAVPVIILGMHAMAFGVVSLGRRVRALMRRG